MQVTTAVATLTVAAGSALVSAAVSLTQAATGAGADLAPYATGGSSAVAVAALVWIAKKIIGGDLVSKPVAEYQREMGVMMAAMGEREDRLIAECVAASKREERLTKALQDADRALWQVGAYLGSEEPRQAPRRQPR